MKHFESTLSILRTAFYGNDKASSDKPKKQYTREERKAFSEALRIIDRDSRVIKML